MRIQNPHRINLNNPLLLSESIIMISHDCLIKLWERAKLYMMSSSFFSNNFSTLPNDKIAGRSKLEAFAEEFKLRHKLFSVMIGWETFFFFFIKENCCLTAFSSFLSMFFQSLPSSIGLAFLNPKPSKVPCFSDILRLPIENHR